MGTKSLRNVVGVLCLGFVASVASMPVDTAAAAGAPVPVKETSWSHALSQLPELTRVLHARHVVALADAKTALAAEVRAADGLFASSKGKASDESRMKLAVERNRAYSIVMVSDDEDAPAVAAAPLAAMVETVKAEVTAWEVAEAARIAEAARVAAAQAAAAQAASNTSSRSRSSAPVAGQTAQQYLEGIASSYGASISWTGTPCGRAAAGCYQGGSTLYVSTDLYSSWSRAKGRGRNVVLHEASHMIIQRKCGTVLLGSSRFENVTDAYSVLLGGAGTGYGYNSNDMAIAQAALGGTCLEG